MSLNGPKLQSKTHFIIESIHSNLVNHSECEDNVISQEKIDKREKIEDPNVSDLHQNSFASFGRQLKNTQLLLFQNNWKKQGLKGFILNVRKIKIVKQVVERFKQMSYFRKPTNLKKYHYHLFDDKSINPFATENKVIFISN